MTCARKKCKRSTDHVSGYCSDVCLQLEQDFVRPAVIVLARNKAGGYGTSPHWEIRTPVAIPRIL